MQKRHDDQLTCRLEEIVTRGSTFIYWNELYLWYGVKAIAAGTYRDLSTRWEELMEEHDLELGELMLIQSPSKVNPGITLFGKDMPVQVLPA